MAKNSNKTEHVLKLIAGGEAAPEPKKPSSPRAAKKGKEADSMPVSEAPVVPTQNTAFEQQILPPQEPEHGPAPDDVKIVVKNVLEGFVDEKMPEVLSRIKCCQCDSCRNDIKAIALNALPPRYIVTRKGELFSKAAACYIQYEADVISAITRAAVVVSARPRHG